MARDLSSGLITEEQARQVIEGNLEYLQKTLQKTIEQLLETYPQKQKGTGKGELKYIYISLLLTSVPFKLPLYRIDFCDEQGQLDLIEHAGYWDISPVSDVIYTDAFTHPNVIRHLSGKENYENEQNWFKNIRVLNEQLANVLSYLVEGIIVKHSIWNILNVEEIHMYSGTYLQDSSFLSSIRI